MIHLYCATGNPGKLREFKLAAGHAPVDIELIPGFRDLPPAVEDGDTFEENAVQKAKYYARFAGEAPIFAEDSGLEVDALGGAPGVYSARFAGREATYEERFRIIYERLQNVPSSECTARFRCAIALAEPSGYVRVVEGALEGVIAESARGANGFGYDPIFLVPESGKTTAEMAPEEKNRISHRGRAAEAARQLLENWPAR